jgi:Holliday junction resolvase
MTNRRRGDYHERRTRDALTAAGWVVVRAAGSLGPADLVALKADAEALLVSCKIAARISPAERSQLLRAAAQAGALPILAWRETRGWVRLDTIEPGPARTPWDVLKVPATGLPW